MSEHAILFSGPMVQAILEGRKTQTRRVIGDVMFLGALKRQDTILGRVLAFFEAAGPGYNKSRQQIKCPYGQPGDHLWVREKHSLWLSYYGKVLSNPYAVMADGAQKYKDGQYVSGLKKYAPGAFDGIKWRPSIHMPRWASRLTLEVVTIRAERLQAITIDDVWAEGIRAPAQSGPGITPQHVFGDLWDDINAKRGHPWASNPWVWVVEFKKVKDEQSNPAAP